MTSAALNYQEEGSRLIFDAMNGFKIEPLPGVGELRTGECPRCEHEIELRLAPRAWAKVGFGDLGSHDKTTEIITFCNCEEEHPGRPADRTGCGLFSVVRVRA